MCFDSTFIEKLFFLFILILSSDSKADVMSLGPASWAHLCERENNRFATERFTESVSLRHLTIISMFSTEYFSQSFMNNNEK
jgi:hypothetical protein